MMTTEKTATETEALLHYMIEPFTLFSEYLDREIKLDAYLPKNIQNPANITLMLINDGQDLEKLGLAAMLDEMFLAKEINPILAIGIHCNADRKLEYGTADLLEAKLRGSRAKFHRKFILKELLPYLHTKYYLPQVKQTVITGFSLGGLSAMDIGWKHPEIFNRVGVFSGSFWWRTKDLGKDYNEETDRIMHLLVREGTYTVGQKFFFETGAQDEKMDRNNNGIIDSIDDTTSLIDELVLKGYSRTDDIQYLELQDGKHDVTTWGRAMPYFLKWLKQNEV